MVQSLNYDPAAYTLNIFTKSSPAVSELSSKISGEILKGLGDTLLVQNPDLHKIQLRLAPAVDRAVLCQIIVSHAYPEYRQNIQSFFERIPPALSPTASSTRASSPSSDQEFLDESKGAKRGGDDEEMVVSPFLEIFKKNTFEQAQAYVRLVRGVEIT